MGSIIEIGFFLNLLILLSIELFILIGTSSSRKKNLLRSLSKKIAAIHFMIASFLTGSFLLHFLGSPTIINTLAIAPPLVVTIAAYIFKQKVFKPMRMPVTVHTIITVFAEYGLIKSIIELAVVTIGLGLILLILLLVPEIVALFIGQILLIVLYSIRVKGLVEEVKRIKSDAKAMPNLSRLTLKETTTNPKQNQQAQKKKQIKKLKE